jgi:hypothetical protein
MSLRTITLPLKNQVPTIGNIDRIGGDAIYEPLKWDNLDTIRLIWLKDVMPTGTGLSSVVVNPLVETPLATTYTASYPYRVENIYDEDGERAYYFRSPGPDIFIKTDYTVQNAGTSGGSTTFTFTCFRGTTGNVFFNTSRLANSYDISTNTWTPLNADGIDESLLKGICNALDYMVAWDDSTIYYSAPGNAGQFEEEVLGVATGAGSFQIVAVIGKIVVCYQFANGFMVHGTDSAVSARYSGDFSQPWIVKEIENSAGISRHDRVAHHNASSIQFVISDKGIQEVNADEAQVVFPDVSMLLSGSEFWNSDGDGTYSITQSYHSSLNIPAPLNSKIGLVNGRYFCISYGVYEAVFKYIMIYDILLKQWGKIKVDHLDVFDFVDIASSDYVAGTSKVRDGAGKFNVLKDNGTIVTYDLQYLTPIPSQDVDITSNGEMTIGDIKFTNEHMVQVNKIQVDGKIGSNFAVYVSYRDAQGVFYAETQFAVGGVGYDTQTFYGDVVGYAVRIRFVGAFNLDKIKIDINDMGPL